MRAEGVEWRVRTELAGDCSLCRGIIPAGELFLDGEARLATGEVCLSCILTAIQGILPGSPRQVVLEIDPKQPVAPVARYVLDVDGKPAGTASVALSLTTTERYAPALLGTVCALLEARLQYQGSPNPRLYESTAGDGWCTGEPPADEPLEVWVSKRSMWTESPLGEFWTLAIWTDDGNMPLRDAQGRRIPPGWRFTRERRPDPSLDVLAWKRGPARPRFLEVRDA